MCIKGESNYQLSLEYGEVGERIELQCNAELSIGVSKILWYLMPINGVSKKGNATPRHVGSWYREQGQTAAVPGYQVCNATGSLIILNYTNDSLQAVHTFECYKFSTDKAAETEIGIINLHGIGE